MLDSVTCDAEHSILLRQHPGYWLPHRIVQNVSHHFFHTQLYDLLLV